MKLLTILTFACMLALATAHAAAPAIRLTPLPDAARGKEIADMKWGLFACWSFSTFSGIEWTTGVAGQARGRAV